MEIIVDDRERAVIPFMEELSNKLHLNYKVQRNEVGDYAIVYRGYILLIIERKTWEDLSSSFRDGRKENVEKLKELRERTGCQIAYLIEGNATPAIDKKYGRLPIRNLRAHLDHLAFRDGVHMVYSKDPEYTAGRLFELAANYLSLKDVIAEIDEKENDEDKDVTTTSKAENGEDKDATTTSKSGGNKFQLKSKMNTDISINEQLLRCLPGVGSIISGILAENGVTLYKLYTEDYSQDDLATLKYQGGQMLGIDKAKKLQNTKKVINSKAAANIKVHIRILTCVPLISKKTAEVILENTSLGAILSGEIDAEQLAGIQKTEKAKLGAKAASNIITHLMGEKDNPTDKLVDTPVDTPVDKPRSTVIKRKPKIVIAHTTEG